MLALSDSVHPLPCNGTGLEA